MTRVNIGRLDLENHLFRELYGMSPPPTVKREGARLMHAVAAAGAGRLSARQRDAFARACSILSVPADEVATLLHAEAATHVTLRADAQAFAAVFVSEGVRVARADGIDAKKRESMQLVAQSAGVEPSLVRALEGFCAIEDALRSDRYRKLGSPRRVETLGTGPLVEAGGHARAFELGHDLGAMPADLGWKCGRAILTIAAADGELSDRELGHFLGIAASMGVPEAGLDDFAKFDPLQARLEEFLDDNLRPIARIVLMDAIRTSRSDGFEERERALAKRGAASLGIEDGWVDAMEAQLASEDALREARAAVCCAPRALDLTRPL